MAEEAVLEPPLDTDDSGVDEILQLASDVSSGLRDHRLLLPHLNERAACYDELGSDDCERLRGVIFSALEHAQWGGKFLKPVQEELRTSYHPEALAGAARAIRGCVTPPPELPAILGEAFARAVPIDKFVDASQFEPTIKPADGKHLTVEVAEAYVFASKSVGANIELTAKLRSEANRLKPELASQIHSRLDELDAKPACESCCGSETSARSSSAFQPFNLPPNILAISAEDQSGNSCSFSRLLGGKPTFLTFFYTRCMNPKKCSATITRLAALSAKLADSGLMDRVNLIAMTYDPDYDIAKRLKAYGMDRGITFDSHTHLVRLPQYSDRFFSKLEVQVGYGASTVNRHGLDAFIIAGDGTVSHSFARELWEVDDVASELAKAAVCSRLANITSTETCS